MPFAPNRRLSSHPLARGLDFFSVATGIQPLDYATSVRSIPTRTGTLTPTMIAAGHAMLFTGATGNRLAWSTPSQNQWRNANDFTVSCLGVIRGTDFPGSAFYPMLIKFANSSSLIGVGFDDAGGNMVFAAAADSLTEVAGAVVIGTFTDASSLGFSTTNIQALYTWRVVGTTVDCFINGNLIETLTLLAHGVNVAAAISTANAGAGLSATGLVKAWYIHNRALSAAEITELTLDPWAPIRPYKRKLAAVVSGAHSVAVGQVAETDLAQPIKWGPKLRLIGQPSETDLAQPIARLKQRTPGQVTETDLSQPMGKVKTRSMGQNSETDLARPMTHPQNRLLGQASETDLAQAIARNHALAVGQASETDLAQPMTSTGGASGGGGTGSEIIIMSRRRGRR